MSTYIYRLCSEYEQCGYADTYQPDVLSEDENICPQCYGYLLTYELDDPNPLGVLEDEFINESFTIDRFNSSSHGDEE